MPRQLADIVRFRDDRLFNGAVSVDWFCNDRAKSSEASRAFVFHGPKYHGVQQEEVGLGHGHLLVDTASLTYSVVRRCYGLEDQPFTLAIAGYGTGKSHFALTLASLVSDPSSDLAGDILSAVDAADEDIGSDTRALLREADQPCLVIALNGLQGFDLAAEITRQVVNTLEQDGLDPRPLDDLRPRFKQAANLIRMSNDEVIRGLLSSCDADTVDDVLAGLDQQDETTYARVHDFFASRDMPIRVLSGESAKDVIDIAVREYCGRGKPYRCLLVLFDEFGKYTEFATVRSQIAGSGALQDLFEAVQANAGNACFVGFIQFELNAYVQRVAPEYRNEILRYVTRFQTANRVYLSTNLETLVAGLLEKRDRRLLDRWFNTPQAKHKSWVAMASLRQWFPQSQNHRLWTDGVQFHSVIREGCWPLSPYSTWLLFYLAAAGKHLQERSALSLLGDVFERHAQAEVADGGEWDLAPVDLWSETLQGELLASEEAGQQGSIAHAYASVIARHGARLPRNLRKLLCAVVLASKLGLQVQDKEDASGALGELAGLDPVAAAHGLQVLQEEHNVLEWDDSFSAYDIVGDAVPRTQFLSFVRRRAASSYDEAGKAALFASNASEWCDLLADIDCDFAERNEIGTREWRYAAATATVDLLPHQVKLAADRWAKAMDVDDPRGTVIYTYVEPSRDAEAVLARAKSALREAAREVGAPTVPVLVVLLCDVGKGPLGQALAEYAVLESGISEEDRARFGHLIGAHQEKLDRAIRGHVDSMIKQRRYVTGLRDDLEATRLGAIGSELFGRIYRNVISFPFDGFGVARGNAADTCQELTQELLLGRLDYEGVIAKPAREKNRAVRVLKESWGVFARNGRVSRRPTLPVLRTITEKWDEALASDGQRLSPSDVIHQLCRPPYGANIASAGLLLGVFIAPRLEKLTVMRNGKQLGMSRWLEDGLFRGKFVDPAALDGVDLILIGDTAPAEWEALLDDWEKAESHRARIECFARDTELKLRVSVPPSQVYREEHLREQAQASKEAVEKLDAERDRALARVNDGADRRDLPTLAQGAAQLRTLWDRLVAEKPLWVDSQITEIQSPYERARVEVMQLFPTWLQRVAITRASPSEVAEFRRRMVQLVGGDLKKLGLDEQYSQLEERTQKLVQNAEAIVSARQLLDSVRTWMTPYSDLGHVTRLAEIRELRKAAAAFGRKVHATAERVHSAGLREARDQLIEFSLKLKSAEEAITKRAAALRQLKLQTEDDLEQALSEAAALVDAYDGLTDEVGGFQRMRAAVRRYQTAYQRLSDGDLTWPGFEALASEVLQECTEAIKSKEVPWPPRNTIDAFVADIRKQRKEASSSWLESMAAEAAGVTEMPAAEANRLHSRLSNPPAILTDPDARKVAAIVKKVTARLDELSVEWLVERYREMPTKARKEFLKRAKQVDDEG